MHMYDEMEKYGKYFTRFKLLAILSFF